MIRPARRRLASAIAFAVATTVALVIPAAVAEAAPSAPTCSLASTGGTVVRNVGGRYYRLNVPAGLTGPSPLLLSLHGGGEPAVLHELETGWNGFAAARRFIVAYPMGNAFNLWNFAAGSPDVAYIRSVVADISANWCVNPRRVHAEGYSNGGSMTNRLGCDAFDLIASFASYAGSSATLLGACTPGRPVANAQMDSALDPILPFELQARLEWAGRNQCSSLQFEFSFLAEVWHHRLCAGGTEVLWVVYYLGSHNWPIGPANADIRNRIWGLFEANPLP